MIFIPEAIQVKMLSKRYLLHDRFWKIATKKTSTTRTTATLITYQSTSCLKGIYLLGQRENPYPYTLKIGLIGKLKFNCPILTALSRTIHSNPAINIIIKYSREIIY